MNYEVECAKKELFELLEKNPELRPLQTTLSKSMDEAREQDRLKILSTFLQYNLSDLTFELLELRRLLVDRFKNR